MSGFSRFLFILSAMCSDYPRPEVARLQNRPSVSLFPRPCFSFSWPVLSEIWGFQPAYPEIYRRPSEFANFHVNMSQSIIRNRSTRITHPRKLITRGKRDGPGVDREVRRRPRSVDAEGIIQRDYAYRVIVFVRNDLPALTDHFEIAVRHERVRGH